MTVCKHYVMGKCNRINCKFEHVDNICTNYYFDNICNNRTCKKIHDIKKKVKNTESFVPVHTEPDIRIKINEKIMKSNEISIHDNILNDNNIYNIILEEINNNTFKKWHGDTHLIADDSINWRHNSPTFNKIIEILSNKLNIKVSATRLNYYTNSLDWKPYHHDAAAIKEHIANKQNITVGVSFGLTREISFQNVRTKNTINIPLRDSIVYCFGNQINSEWKHSIPQFNKNINEGRISIIIWGYTEFE